MKRTVRLLFLPSPRWYFINAVKCMLLWLLPSLSDLKWCLCVSALPGWGAGVDLPLLDSSTLTWVAGNQPFWRFLPRAWSQKIQTVTGFQWGFKSDSQFFFQSSWLLECYAKTKGMFMSEQIIISFFSERKKTPLLVRVNKTDLSVCFSLLVPFRSFWLNYLTNNVICCTVHFTNTTSSD